MKKTLFFLFCTLVLLPGCSKDESMTDNQTNSSNEKVRWYGVKTVKDETSTRGVADEAKIWNQRVGISIKFINNPSNVNMIAKIKTIASEWENYAGVKFHFLGNTQNADVRIAFDWNGNDWLTWSYTGTDAKRVTNQSQPTAVFGGLQYQDEEQFKGDVLRVFGQILGLEYEQRHQEWSFWRNESQLQSYWMSMFDGMNMNWNEIKDYVFTPLSGKNAIFPTQTPQIDELSVMAWPYYLRAQTTKPLANYELSEGDKQFIATLYPKDKNSLPTIQEAWVDAGFFKWRNKENTESYLWREDMVGLIITDLGKQQETLPDVSDGEQLNSVSRMFSAAKYLKKAPIFNTSNVTQFDFMFEDCSSLTSIPLYDTSKGTSFVVMFTNCSSLTTIPLLNTSNGTNFIRMFEGCTSLITIPLLDTSKGTSFSSMFRYCKSLITIPQLNTSNGTSFDAMLFGCSSLTNIPLYNTSKGTSFNAMFVGCSSLTTIPLLDTSKGTNFYTMFAACTSLTSIPKLNTSNGTQFAYMFQYCRSLTIKPELDISKAPNLSSVYKMFEGTPFENSL